MAPTAFAKAEADRASHKDHLEFLEQELNSHGAAPLSPPQVQIYMIELEETRKLLAPNHSSIRSSAPAGTDMGPIVTEYRSLCQLASRIYAGFHGIQMTFPAAAAATTTTSTSSSSGNNIKLPRLELPKFGGNLQEWVSFRDLFVTAVDKSSLTKVEKLTQLKSLLTGEAARQIRSIVLSDANYDIAWQALKERYENNRELLFSVLKRLFNQPIVTSGSAVHLRSLIDTTKECMRSLEVLAIPTQHWDAVLLYLLFSKMDAGSRELWEQSLPDTNVPTLAKMYEFLEQRSRALSASNPPPPQRGQPGKQQQQ